MTDRDEGTLRRLFREIHARFDPPPPPYAGLIRAAGARPVRARRTGAAIVAAAGLVVLAGTLLLVMRDGFIRNGPDDEMMCLAAELSVWEAPTDFLLQTPGLEFLRSTPRFGASIEDLPGDPVIVMPKETQ